ncbi:hypothetical protein GCM10027610_140870 [Dactylosporangium cerinum]
MAPAVDRARRDVGDDARLVCADRAERLELPGLRLGDDNTAAVLEDLAAADGDVGLGCQDARGGTPVLLSPVEPLSSLSSPQAASTVTAVIPAAPASTARRVVSLIGSSKVVGLLATPGNT